MRYWVGTFAGTLIAVLFWSGVADIPNPAKVVLWLIFAGLTIAEYTGMPVMRSFRREVRYVLVGMTVWPLFLIALWAIDSI